MTTEDDLAIQQKYLTAMYYQQQSAMQQSAQAQGMWGNMLGNLGVVREKKTVREFARAKIQYNLDAAKRVLDENARLMEALERLGDLADKDRSDLAGLV